MTKFILTSPTGNLGSRVLFSIVALNLIPPSDLILTTSSPSPSDPSVPPRIPLAHQNNIPIRYSVDFTKTPEDIAPKLEGGDVLFLSSYPSPSIDRWLYHKNAIDAALIAGIKTIIYTSLMFGGESGLSSVAGVQQAHIKTISYLDSVRSKLRSEYKTFDFIVVREGIYAESWNLYAGFQPKSLTKAVGGSKGEMEWVIPNDGKIAWVTWDDLGEGTAKIIAGYEKYLGKTLRLTGPRATSIRNVADMLEVETGWKVRLREVGKEEARRWHVERGNAEGWVVESWSGWYQGIKDGECEGVDPLLQELLGRPVRGVEELGGQLFKIQDAEDSSASKFDY